MLGTFRALAGLVLLALSALQAMADDRPNILWITSEDNGCELGCYGDEYATTPNLDALASRSMRYVNAWSNAPVCAPARTTIITGMWPPSLGASHMRSEVRLPPGVQMFPQLLRAAGYYCTNNAKEDYNAAKPDQVWDESSNKAHWRNRKAGQPFFAVFNATISHESQIRNRPHKAVHDPAQMRVPEYHPDLPEVRQDWAQYYDRLTEMDTQLGRRLKELQQDGLTDSTIIVYFGDHGSGMPRGKRWLYQSGLHVPLLVSVPDKFKKLAGARYQSGSVSEEMVSFLDLAPTMLGMCGIEAPNSMDGRSFLGPDAKEPWQYLFGFRDRMDERYDCSRSVRDNQYLYIRNFMPHRAQGQYLDYMYQTPTTVVWLNAAKSGKCNEVQSLFWKIKPAEELYDIQADPQQLNNLIADAKYTDVKVRLKEQLQSWMIVQKDLGLMPEAIMKAKAPDQPNALAPYDIGDMEFDVMRVWEAADKATDLSQDLASTIALTQDQSPIVRYWGNIGLVYRALHEPAAIAALQESAHKNDAPEVQSVALEGLARCGNPDQRAGALAKFFELAANPDHSFYQQMMVCDCLLACNVTASELPKKLELRFVDNTNIPERYSPYVVRTEVALKLLAEHPEYFTPIK